MTTIKNMGRPLRDRNLLPYFRGTFFGAAIGDALGQAIEFLDPDQIKQKFGVYPMREYSDKGPFRFRAGDVTDDTAQAFLLAEALIKFSDVDPVNNYEGWYNEFGNGLVKWARTAPDIGGTTLQGISAYRSGLTPADMLETAEIESNRDPQYGSNGSAMRAYPVAMRFYDSLDELVEVTKLASIITHPYKGCIDAAILENVLIRVILLYRAEKIRKSDEPVTKEEILQIAHKEVRDFTDVHFESAERVYSGKACKSRMGALDAVQLAVHYWLNTDTAEDAIVGCCNAGGDNDTHGCIAGALSGAWYGFDNLPKYLVGGLIEKCKVDRLACKLYELTTA